jgi:hypothetical protein
MVGWLAEGEYCPRENVLLGGQNFLPLLTYQQLINLSPFPFFDNMAGRL